jgi:hypothetical protein
LKEVRLDGHAECVRENRNKCVILKWEPETNRSFGDTDIGIRITLIRTQ